MARPTMSKSLSPAASKRAVPLWLVLCLAGAMCLLLYGVMQPKTPSAFDLPEAQTTFKARAPWDMVR